MLLLEYHMTVAATKIVSILKGINTRARLREILALRKRSTLYLQAFFRFR